MAATEGPRRPAQLRLFFALWPDDAVRAALASLTARLAAECGGRATDTANLHLTLAFLGMAPAERVDDFVAAAQSLRGEPFELRLDQVGYWRHSRVAWAGATLVSPALARLAEDMKGALQAMAWPVEDRPYSPHVTLVRDAVRPPQTRGASVPPWAVREFVLVRSTQDPGGVRYEPLHRWRLTS